MALRCAYLLMHRHVDAHFVTAGITADQFVLLTALRETGTQTQQELANQIAADPNTLRAMLLLLEKKQLLHREPHPTDGRARLVSLTPAGEKLQSKLWQESEGFRQNLAALLGHTDSETLIRLLNQLSQALTP